MQLKLMMISILLFGVTNLAVSQSRVFPGNDWQVADQADTLGWSGDKLQAARNYAASIDTAAVMVVAGGIVIDQWGDTTRKFNVHSVRKSLLSALIGIYEVRGAIDLEATLEDLGIDDNLGLTDSERKARLLDLLC